MTLLSLRDIIHAVQSIHLCHPYLRRTPHKLCGAPYETPHRDELCYNTLLPHGELYVQSHRDELFPCDSLLDELLFHNETLLHGLRYELQLDDGQSRNDTPHHDVQFPYGTLPDGLPYGTLPDDLRYESQPRGVRSPYGTLPDALQFRRELILGEKLHVLLHRDELFRNETLHHGAGSSFQLPNYVYADLFLHLLSIFPMHLHNIHQSKYQQPFHHSHSYSNNYH